MNLADAVLRAAVLKTLADDVAAAVTEGKAAIGAEMASQRIRSLTAELPDSTEVAALTRAGGKDAPRITDPARFAAWVAEAHPSEIEQVVRPGYAEALLKGMRQAGRNVDPKTGEMVPGVEFAPTTSYVSVRFADGGREAIRQAWRNNEISLPEVLEAAALPAGENGEAPT